jgi:hypothetical protein
MRRVIYISRSYVANDSDALDAIVEASSVRNAAAGIRAFSGRPESKGIHKGAPI